MGLVALIGWPAVLLLWVRDWRTALLFPPLALLLFAASFRSGLSRWFLTNPWVTVVGDMCYFVYLLHYLTIAIVAHVTESIGQSSIFAVHMLVQFALQTPIIVLGSLVYFVLLERPCTDRDWPRKLEQAARRLLAARRPTLQRPTLAEAVDSFEPEATRVPKARR
jgi:peptidoglycan/LPS O-acetylase OafA/YrhL